MEGNCFRQVCDKPCNQKIALAEWSPTRDLIALMTSGGDVRLHRLYWQKVWSLPARDRRATALAWRSDGNRLSIGFNDGTVQLVEIEKADVVYTLNCDSSILTLQWATQENSTQYTDFNSQFLIPLEKTDKLKSPDKKPASDFNVLIIAEQNGAISFYSEGIFPILQIQLNQPMNIFKSCFDPTNGVFYVVYSSKNDEERSFAYMERISTNLSPMNSSELTYLSEKLTNVNFAIEKCDKKIKQMAEASEDVSLRINGKLGKLDELLNSTEESVACAFTCAYATGNACAEMQTFLTQHLTTKGLKQISQSVQLCYKSLLTDTSDGLLILLQHLHFLLIELHAMEEIDKFNELGISTESVKSCLELVNQLTFKTHVFLHVLSSDMKNFQIFFSWLLNFVYKLTGEENPLSTKAFTNDEYDSMLDFLENLLLKSDDNNFSVERVSQFFSEDKLEIFQNSDNVLEELCNKDLKLKNNFFIIKTDKTSSITTLFGRLKNEFNVVYTSVKDCLSKSLIRQVCVNLFELQPDHDASCSPCFSFLCCEQHVLLSVVPCTCNADNVFVLQVDKNAIKARGIVAESSEEEETCTMRDAVFYDNETLTILYETQTEECTSSVFGQALISRILEHPSMEVLSSPVLDTMEDIEWLNLSDAMPERRRLDNYMGRRLCVNGYSRRISCVISACGRRVRVFDMTAADEEESD